MKRAAFKMKLREGCAAEYKKRHDAIWPELSKELTRAGIEDYSIYLDPQTLILFAVHKLTEENTAERLPQNPVVRKWWAYMADLMETNPDGSPASVPLLEMFHLD